MTQSLLDKHLKQLVVSLFKMMVVSYLSIDFKKIDTVAKLLFDATDEVERNDGVQVATEDAGDSLILDGTDESSLMQIVKF